MTRRRIAEPMTKHTLDLFTQDMQRMRDLYPDVGVAAAVRALVRQHLLRLARKETELVSVIGELDIDIERE